ncbi:MAG: hypothetical protein CME98_06655 [Hyphomonas sp.]|nr:hypothetical protein [Hyphomonas sp.]
MQKVEEEIYFLRRMNGVHLVASLMQLMKKNGRSIASNTVFYKKVKNLHVGHIQTKSKKKGNTFMKNRGGIIGIKELLQPYTNEEKLQRMKEILLEKEKEKKKNEEEKKKQNNKR